MMQRRRSGNVVSITLAEDRLKSLSSRLQVGDTVKATVKRVMGKDQYLIKLFDITVIAEFSGALAVGDTVFAIVESMWPSILLKLVTSDVMACSNIQGICVHVLEAAEDISLDPLSGIVCEEIERVVPRVPHAKLKRALEELITSCHADVYEVLADSCTGQRGLANVVEHIEEAVDVYRAIRRTSFQGEKKDLLQQIGIAIEKLEVYRIIQAVLAKSIEKVPYAQLPLRSNGEWITIEETHDASGCISCMCWGDEVWQVRVKDMDSATKSMIVESVEEIKSERDHTANFISCLQSRGWTVTLSEGKRVNAIARKPIIPILAPRNFSIVV